MKQKIIFLLLGMSIIGCSVTSRSLSAQISLGSATIRCKYDMSYKEDTTSNKYKNDLIYLDIGAEAALCYSFYNSYRDSQRKALLKQGKGAMEVGAQTSDLRKGVQYVMAKQYKTKTLFVSDVLIDTYMYTEPIPQIEWKVRQDTCTILSYPCRKATAQFRGRSWIAWFTTEIPLSEGPWQFSGLPGLIMQLEDTQKHYTITCSGIEQLAPPEAMLFQTVTFDGTAYKKITREQLAKQKREMYENLEDYLYNYHSMRTISSSAPPRPRPYNPIELK